MNKHELYQEAQTHQKSERIMLNSIRLATPEHSIFFLNNNKLTVSINTSEWKVSQDRISRIITSRLLNSSEKYNVQFSIKQGPKRIDVEMKHEGHKLSVTVEL